MQGRIPNKVSAIDICTLFKQDFDKFAANFWIGGRGFPRGCVMERLIVGGIIRYRNVGIGVSQQTSDEHGYTCRNQGRKRRARSITYFSVPVSGQLSHLGGRFITGPIFLEEFKGALKDILIISPYFTSATSSIQSRE
jgi:hypothetical protein